MEIYDYIPLICFILANILLWMYIYNSWQERRARQIRIERERIDLEQIHKNREEERTYINREPCQACGGRRGWGLSPYTLPLYKAYYCSKCIDQYKQNVSLIAARHKYRPKTRLGLFVIFGDNGLHYEEHSWNVRMVLSTNYREAAQLLKESSWNLIKIDASKPLKIEDKKIIHLRPILIDQFKCEDCHTILTNEESIPREDPYLVDMNGDHSVRRLCEKCFEIAREEI